MVYTIKWGILATGGIAKTFVLDLIKDPKTRGVQDIAHQIVAVASSTSKDRAQAFIKDNSLPGEIEAYGDYKSLVSDKNVDIVYVASPHGLHYEHAKLVLEAGKHCLCEKAFTINEPQAVALINLAKQKKVFLMEAVWTRFFPVSKELQRLLFEEKTLGKLHRVIADNCMDFSNGGFDVSHRIYNPALGGGALLDLGIYSLTWVFMIAFTDPDNKRGTPQVTSQILKDARTGVDETTNMLLTFPNSKVSAVALTSLIDTVPEDYIARIVGSKGYIIVHGRSYRPTGFTIHLNGQEPVRKDFEIPGHGMFWEADECARQIRDGKLESPTIDLEESRIIMEVMDTVRKQSGFKYPADVEAVN